MRSLASVVSIVLMLVPAESFGADGPGASNGSTSKAACMSAYEGAQISMKRAQLQKAHGELAICISDVCPQALRSDCATWLKEVEAREPTVVFSYIDAMGKSRRDVRVLIGGVPVLSELDGRGHAIDPGVAVITFEPQGGKASEVRALVREGQKLQLVEYREPSRLAPIAVVPKDSAVAAPSRIPLYVGLSVLGVGLAGFGGFGAWGLSGKSSLESCKPFCTEDEAGGVRTRFIVADVSLAIAAVGAVITVISLASLASHSPRNTTSAYYTLFTGQR